MANEISVGCSLNISKGGLVTTSVQTKPATLSGSNQFQNVQNIGIAAEQLDLGETVFTPQYILITNQDVTNYVELALDAPVTAQIFAKLMPGDSCMFPAKTGTMYLKANTAPVNVAVTAVGA